jgi:hypothetical protein
MGFQYRVTLNGSEVKVSLNRNKISASSAKLSVAFTALGLVSASSLRRLAISIEEP